MVLVDKALAVVDHVHGDGDEVATQKYVRNLLLTNVNNWLIVNGKNKEICVKLIFLLAVVIILFVVHLWATGARRMMIYGGWKSWVKVVLVFII